MKIDTNILKKFIEKVSLNGSIMTINLNFTETGAITTVKDFTSTALTNGTLFSSAFEDYKPIGELFLKDSAKFIKYLKTFDGKANIEQIEDYILKIYDEKRTGYIILGAKNICENIYTDEMPKLETDVSIILHKDDLSKTIKDLKELKETRLTMEKTETDFLLSVGNKDVSDAFINNMKSDTTGSGKVALGEPIINVYDVLDNEFTISFKSNSPVIIEESLEHMKITTIIAPLTEE